MVNAPLSSSMSVLSSDSSRIVASGSMERGPMLNCFCSSGGACLEDKTMIHNGFILKNEWKIQLIYISIDTLDSEKYLMN